MSFNLPLITLVPQTVARSADVNADFTAFNTQGMQSLISDKGVLATTGYGGIRFSGRLGTSIAGDLLDASNLANVYIKCPNAGGTFHFAVPTGTEVASLDASGMHMPGPDTVMNFFEGSMGRLSYFAGTGSGTYTHGLSIAPNWVCPIVTVDGATTRGFDNAGATSVHITMGDNALAFKAWCIR